jgi:SAM-dependent methyltransferase
VNTLKRRCSNPIFIGAINNNHSDCISTLFDDIKKNHIHLKEFYIDYEDYLQYVNRAEYRIKYSDYDSNNFFEKSLEHYLCHFFLNLGKKDILIDIASEQSPVSEIFSRLSGCKSYSQDIMFKRGIHENKIGCDASEIPVPNNFFTAAIATCSIEHFENDSDIRFMKEIERVLKTSGKCIIVPLYLFNKHSCQTDPQYSVPGNVIFDKEADIYCAENCGNRHARFYSVITLIERLIKPNKEMQFEIYFIKNSGIIDRSVYCRFFLVGEKK